MKETVALSVGEIQIGASFQGHFCNPKKTSVEVSCGNRRDLICAEFMLVTSRLFLTLEP